MLILPILWPEAGIMSCENNYENRLKYEKKKEVGKFENHKFYLSIEKWG